jgi:hypothetical protein
VARRQHDDRHRRGGADEAGEIEAGFAGHHDVEDQQIEMQAEQLGAGVGGARRGGDAIALAGQKARQQIADAAVVVDQQQMRGVVGRLRRRPQVAACDGCSLRHGHSLGFLPPVPKIASSTLSGSSRSIIARRNWRTASCAGGIDLPAARG